MMSSLRGRCGLCTALLISILLSACSAPTAQPEGSYRIVNRVDIDLRPVKEMDGDASFRRSFERRDIEGGFTESGAWTVKGVVPHTRLLCGIYEMGLQVGRGEPACTAVEWYSDIQFRTRERQCNSASILHSGRGTLPLSREQLINANCVRVVTRCSGSCG